MELGSGSSPDYDPMWPWTNHQSWQQLPPGFGTEISCWSNAQSCSAGPYTSTKENIEMQGWVGFS